MLSKSIALFTIIFILAWMAIPSVQGQKAGNLEVVKNLYDALQKNSITSNDIAAMTPTLKSEEVKSTEGITTTFQHLWTLKDGEIIHFNEY